MESKAKSRSLVRKGGAFAEPWTASGAILHGNWATKLSVLIMGFGNLIHGQIVKGLLFLSIQVLYVYYMITAGIPAIKMLPTLGWLEQVETWNEEKMIYEYAAGHNSVLILLWGVVAISISFAFFFIWRAAVKSAYKADLLHKEGSKVNRLKDDIHDLFDEKIHNLLLTLPVLGVLIFTVLPLVYMIAMAFTNYSKENDHLVLFDWVGFDNFTRVVNMQNSVGQAFWPVLGWTVIWAVLATALNFILGLSLAMLIGRKRTRLKSMWRVIFAFTIAVPQFVSLLIIRTMLQPQGAINMLLIHDLKWIAETDPLPFLTNPMWARFTVVIINLWVGIPYTLLQVTGILQNFPEEYTEAARIDGANSVVIFFKITMPYVLFIMSPYIITQFTGNINNFNVIYLLSGGGPPRPNSTAGYTDLLVTWLYKLTVDQQYYNIGAVIGIFTFVTLSIVALVTYRSSGSYKDEEGFQ